MPYADLEKRKAYDKARYQANRESVAARTVIRYYEKREKLLAEMAAYRIANREKLLAQKKEYYIKNREKILTKTKEDRPKNRIRANAYVARRRKEDPCFRVELNLRGRIWAALQGKSKSANTLALLGCTIEFLREHLEKQFQPGMTWENYGPIWHVDHILPCSEFHLQHSEEQEICFHWTNLQPLFAAENFSKGDKII